MAGVEEEKVEVEKVEEKIEEKKEASPAETFWDIGDSNY
jgi:dihydroxyacetone kinase DhaKLM complex PTS-EIIA-like component DhaM